MHLKGGGHDKR
ncbi:Protein of unknown function [Bacillus wiedmannii]|uniref:Uncharacterized protein n=1 Tax=Bacillus wiedmannii TaxID=1890302 RepID=A0A1C4AIM5_9BACI|nr:Protein of unknown function [Bacillus wiedmannii]